MNYIKIDSCDTVNTIGGVAVSLWVQGCPHHCDGCFNQETWDKNGGKLFTDDTIKNLKKILGNNYVSGFSVLGGEPFAPYNITKVLEIIKEIKSEYPHLTIMVWSGYLVNDLIKDYDLTDIDYIVEGRFIKSLSTKKRLRGSDNQKLIDVKNNFAIID